MRQVWRVVLAFVILWMLYQAAEGVGDRWLHSFPVQAGFMVACVVVAWPLSRWLGYRGYAAYALAGGSGLRWWLPGGLLLAVLAKFAAVWIGLRMGTYAADPASAVGGFTRVLTAVPLLLLSTFVASLAEDILTRGFWYRAAQLRWRSGVLFALVSSTLYVANHIYRLGNGPMEWLMLFCFGLAYAAALWRSGSLWAALGLHWGWNLGNGLVAMVMPATTMDVQMSKWLSIGMHLLMLVVLLLFRPTAPKDRLPARADAQAAGLASPD